MYNISMYYHINGDENNKNWQSHNENIPQFSDVHN